MHIMAKLQKAKEKEETLEAVGVKDTIRGRNKEQKYGRLLIRGQARRRLIFLKH